LSRLGGAGKSRVVDSMASVEKLLCAKKWINSPSKRYTLELSALHNLAALSAIALKTGCKSVGELLMTCNTSAVAVCCSSASRVSVMSRAFSIAMTACAAKFCKRAICLSVNGRTSRR